MHSLLQAGLAGFAPAEPTFKPAQVTQAETAGLRSSSFSSSLQPPPFTLLGPTYPFWQELQLFYLTYSF